MTNKQISPQLNFVQTSIFLSTLDTRWYINVRSKADEDQLNLAHAPKKWKK